MSRMLPFKRGSLIFAPMEGVTDEAYRLTIKELYPEWDYFNTDFLRVPSQGHYSKEKYTGHIGSTVLNDDDLLSKTGYQILTTAKAQTRNSVEEIKKLPIKHLDLNLGCPSKKVNSHKGGAYLLGDLTELEKILKEIRDSIDFHFSVKIRTGYKDTNNFDELLKTIQDCGVDSVTVHGRTKEQLYKGKANWSFIKRAVEVMDIPVIGNGDLWSIEDVEEMFNQTGCHSVMLGRGALKTPWFATLYKEHKDIAIGNEAYLLEVRKQQVVDYFNRLEKNYVSLFNSRESFILGRFKSFSRYMFEDFQEADAMRSKFLRASDLKEFNSLLDQI